MTERKTDTANVNESTVDNIIQFVVKESKKIAKEDFTKFGAIAAVIFSIALWGIKSIWYAYLSGKFWVYKVDKCYIHADNENIFLQIIQLASIVVIWFLIDYMYYKISVAEDESRFCWKRKRNKLIFWMVEMGLAFVAVLLFSHTNSGKLIGEITIGDILEILILDFVLCLIINIYAIELSIEERLKKKKEKKNSTQENKTKKSKDKRKKEERIKDMFILFIATIAIELIIIFIASMQVEYSRCGYKIIMVQSEKTVKSEFDIEYAKDNSKYEVYPVVHEEQNYYIVTRLYNEDGKIRIDYNYQRIIEKEGQETIYVDNVYTISGNN